MNFKKPKNSRKTLLFFAFYFLALGVSFTQGRVVFDETSEIQDLMNRYMNYNIRNSTIIGYRIQIISTSDRRAMDEARSRFNNIYPSMSVSWKHVPPNYQVRVGAFRTKAELMNVMEEIRRNFPMSTSVQDSIDKKDLIPYE